MHGKDATVAFKLIEAKDRSGVARTEVTTTTSTTERPDTTTYHKTTTSTRSPVGSSARPKDVIQPPTAGTTSRRPVEAPTIKVERQKPGAFKFFDEN